MSTPSRTPTPPPPGSLEAVAAPKSRFRITVLTILALHVVFIGGLLLQGCQKQTQDTLASDSNTNTSTSTSLPSLAETQYFSQFPGGDTTSSGSTTPSSSYAPPAFSSTPDPVSTSSSAVSQPSSFEPAAIPEVRSSVTDSSSYSTSSSLSSTFETPPTLSQMTEHVIKSGETIGSLASQYGVTVQAILDANPEVQPRRLKIGSVLQIPSPTGTVARAQSEPVPPPGGDIYIVKAGDNLTKIARKFGVTVREIRSANNMRNDRILPKQRLIIPPKGDDNLDGTISGNGRGNG